MSTHLFANFNKMVQIFPLAISVIIPLWLTVQLLCMYIMYAGLAEATPAPIWSKSSLANVNIFSSPTPITFTGNYSKTVTSVTISGYPCTILNVTTEPCKIKKTRVEACDYLNVVFSNNFVQHQTCENGEPCKNGENQAQACPGPDSTTICARIRCMMMIQAPTIECFDWPLNLTSYQCGPNSVCGGSGACLDARDDSCPTHITCLPGSHPVGTYPIQVTTSSSGTSTLPASLSLHVLDYPLIYSVSNSIGDTKYYSEGSILFASEGSDITLVHSPTLYSLGATAVYTINGIQQTPGFLDSDLNPTLTMPSFTLPYGVFSLDLQIVGVISFTGYPGISFSVPYTGFVRYVKTPVVNSLCPAIAVALVPTTIAVQGQGFLAETGKLNCKFDSKMGAVDIVTTYQSEGMVLCKFTATNDTTGSYVLSVTNDGVVYSSEQMFVTVVGSCSAIKPNSVPASNYTDPSDACKCTSGFKDTKYACIPCDDGSYQPLAGESSCFQCDSTESTGGVTGSTSRDACICKDGRYRANPGDLSCELCTDGLVCEDGEVGLQSGYWRSSESNLYGVPCTSAGCKGGFGSGDELCEQGYEGPLCLVCSDGYASITGGSCVKCEKQSVNIIVVIIVFFLCGAIIFALVRITTRVELTNEKGSLGSAIKICFSYVQMLYYIGSLDAKWSARSAVFFASMIPSTISPTFISFQCATGIDFYTRMGVTMALPLICGSFLAIFFIAVKILVPNVLKNKLGIMVEMHDYMLTLYIVLYMIHPKIALDILSSLKCVPVKGTGSHYLQEDMRINCDSPDYKSYLGIAFAYLFLYVFGAIVFVIQRMRSHSEDLKLMIKGTTMAGQPSQRFFFFARGYKEDMYLWEATIIARKIWIVGCSAILSNGLQLVWSFFALATALGSTLMYKPYDSVMDTRMDSLALIALVITIILGFHSIFANGEPGTDSTVFSLLILVNVFVFSYIIYQMMIRAKKSMSKVIDEYNSSSSTNMITMRSRTGGMSEINIS